MFEVLEFNKENLVKCQSNYICEDNVYKILLKTGQYIKAKDIIYLNIIIIFLIKIVLYKQRKLNK